MAAKDQNFEMFAGDDKRLIYTVEDMETLLGATVKWRLAEDPEEIALIEKTSEDPAEIEISENTFTVKLKPEDTADLDAPRNYYHEAEIIDAANNSTTVAVGIMKLFPSLIQPEEG